MELFFFWVFHKHKRIDAWEPFDGHLFTKWQTDISACVYGRACVRIRIHLHKKIMRFFSVIK